MSRAPRIRRLTTIEEYGECARLQKEVWGFQDVDILPPRLMKVGLRTGALTLGAFDGAGRLIAFLHGFPGEEGGRRIHCSHMLGVRDGARDRNLGFLLKREQRRFVLERGLSLVTWTFDPLESRNAWFNLHKLGATSHEYLVDVYGGMESDLHRGLPTDRFLVRWRVRTARVRARMEGRFPPARLPPGAEPLLEAERGPRGGPRPGPPRLRFRAPALLVPIPRDIQELKVRDLSAAREWRLRTRQVFRAAFARGYRLEDYLPGSPEEGTGTYVLRRRRARST